MRYLPKRQIVNGERTVVSRRRIPITEDGTIWYADRQCIEDFEDVEAVLQDRELWQSWDYDNWLRIAMLFRMRR